MMSNSALKIIIAVCFFLTGLGPSPWAHADLDVNLPPPGSMVELGPAYEPVMIKGLTVHQDNPFLFDFIVSAGQDHASGLALKKEGERLIKYFLAGLAIPDEDLWVNLSPYEKDRMIPEQLGRTDMGRALLEEDYILKQITASLMYPQRDLGRKFWERVYAKAQKNFGSAQVPLNAFHKVWITAERAQVYEQGQTVFVVDSHLKVMLDEDYLAAIKGTSPFFMTSHDSKKRETSPLLNHTAQTSKLMREIILPELEKEVNQGRNFAALRQVFNSVILASWYKKNLKSALLNHVYSDQGKVNGILAEHARQKQDEIYAKYLKAYKKGVFHYIQEGPRPRRYFSGGITGLQMDPAMSFDRNALNSLLRYPLVRLRAMFVRTRPQGPSANDEHIRSIEPALVAIGQHSPNSFQNVFPLHQIENFVDDVIRRGGVLPAVAVNSPDIKILNSLKLIIPGSRLEDHQVYRSLTVNQDIKQETLALCRNLKEALHLSHQRAFAYQNGTVYLYPSVIRSNYNREYSALEFIQAIRTVLRQLRSIGKGLVAQKPEQAPESYEVMVEMIGGYIHDQLGLRVEAREGRLSIPSSNIRAIHDVLRKLGREILYPKNTDNARPMPYKKPEIQTKNPHYELEGLAQRAAFGGVALVVLLIFLTRNELPKLRSKAPEIPILINSMVEIRPIQIFQNRDRITWSNPTVKFKQALPADLNTPRKISEHLGIPLISFEVMLPTVTGSGKKERMGLDEHFQKGVAYEFSFPETYIFRFRSMFSEIQAMNIRAGGLSPGGIDLNASGGMQWKDSKAGRGVHMDLDPAAAARMEAQGMDGLSVVIDQVFPYHLKV